MNIFKSVLSMYVCILIVGPVARSQETGDVFLNAYGVGFTIPEGWMGQELEDAYLIASTEEAGLLVLVSHPARSLDELQNKLREGLHEDDVSLMPSGPVQILDEQSLAGPFAGRAGGGEVHGFIMARLNSLGPGAAVIALVSRGEENEGIRDLGLQVLSSLQFQTPSGKGHGGLSAAQCSADLGGNKLVYVDAYTSLDRSPDQSGVGGGYELRKEINLCPSGFFTYFGSSFVSAGSRVSTVYAMNRAEGHGRWEFREEQGEVLLVLTYHDGQIQSLVVHYEEDATYLNDGRYYLDDADCY